MVSVVAHNKPNSPITFIKQTHIIHEVTYLIENDLHLTYERLKETTHMQRVYEVDNKQTFSNITRNREILSPTVSQLLSRTAMSYG